MFFIIANEGASIQTDQQKVILTYDPWNSNGFKTLFRAKYCENGSLVYLGSVNIGFAGMRHGKTMDVLPAEFNMLEVIFFSLGASEEYYQNLNKLEEKTRIRILASLRDMAFDLRIWRQFELEEVVRLSLIAGLSAHSVKSQLHRMAHGGARLTRYNFKYTSPETNSNNCRNKFTLQFDVIPEATPPTNIHVIIGRNGIGKTYLLKNMIKALVSDAKEAGRFDFLTLKGDEDDHQFANIMCIAFSPFDDYSALIEIGNSYKLPFKYIGLDRKCSDLLGVIKNQFMLSFKNCMSVYNKTKRWERTISLLNDDPTFLESQICKFSEMWQSNRTARSNAAEMQIAGIFSNLSSGHKIVLLIITECVDKLEERTVLFFDEPENHLHPPLLGSFIRALSSLLIDRNGVAILSTHSPVVLQEVPSSCVWRIRRNNQIVTAERLHMETFGTSVSQLTSEVFGLEITYSGFHKMLQDMVANLDDDSVNFNTIENIFKFQLGNEAQALARTLISARNDSL